MNKQIQSGIITAALTTVLGTSLSLIGSNYQTIASNAEASVDRNQQTSETTFSKPQHTSNSEINSIVTVESYQWKGKQAVILRVKEIPVLSFLESEQINPDKVSGTTNKPVKLANQVASRLNQLHQTNFDAEQILVSWDKDTDSYVIKIEDEVLVRFDGTVILPDTTKQAEQDALQATNRLRRLLGDAEPVKEIAGKPKPQPKPIQTASAVKGARRGIASWYGPGFHGRQTANGERFNQNALTAAHRTLPFGTRVRVTNLNNGSSVVVRINDRGPFSRGRIIDLSAGAARAIGLQRSGVAPVSIEVLGR